MPPGMTAVHAGVDAGGLSPRQCEAVGWIYSADYVSRATCFLVHPEWIMTAGHVLMRTQDAADSIVVFNYLEGVEPPERASCVLCPELGFIQQLEPLDVCLVRVCAGLPLDRWGVVDLASAAPAPPQTRFTMIHHPSEGNFKAWSTGRVTGDHEGRLRHDAPSMKGSSGAPLLDDAGRFIGVHSGEAPPRLGGWRAVAATDIVAWLRRPRDLPAALREVVGDA